MLKIAPIPDAAYEICTIFAPNCRSQSRQSGHSNMRNYDPVVRTTSSTYYESTNIGDSQTVPSSSYTVKPFSTAGSYYETNYDNLHPPRSYGRTSERSGPNVSYNEQDENLVKGTENDYENGSEEGNEDTEDSDNYKLAYRPVNVTYAARPTVETFLNNQSAVS